VLSLFKMELAFSAVNSENDAVNKIKNQVNGEWNGVPEVARFYKSKGIQWVTVGDENYGESLGVFKRKSY
jgi:aconitate hydratase